MKRKLFVVGIICLIAFCPIADFADAQNNRPIVKLVYFHPKDVNPRHDIDAGMHDLIVNVQRFFADEMERHGYGSKTFIYEASEDGKAIIYKVPGKHNTAFYQDDPYLKVSQEVWESLELASITYRNDIILTIGTSNLNPYESSLCPHYGGVGTPGNGNGGFALVCADASESLRSPFITTAHELGHAFGLQHDFRSGSNNYIMSYGPIIRPQLSHCTAEWLDIHRAFNPGQTAANKSTTIEMLPPSFDSSPNAIRLRFKVTDLDGLHQAQLLTPTVTPGIVYGFPELLSYKALNGTTNTTVEFVTTDLTPNNKSVSLMAIDVHGNFTWNFQKFPINVTSLLPQAKVVSIPDANLVAAVRQTFRLSSRQAITTHSMLNLLRLDVPNSGITNLTGLEHAHNLRSLNIGSEYIEGEGLVNSNTVSDLSALSELTNLTSLNLQNTYISDMSPLSELTQLTWLVLDDNTISDVSALSGLTNLTSLNLQNTYISDVSPLSELTQLTWLVLNDNTISDVSALSGLTNLTSLNLQNTNISDVSPLQGMTQLETLILGNNNISDVSTLSELKQLIVLHLHDNNISDVSPLVKLNLTGTQWNNTGLYLWNNPLNYVSINTHIPAMQAKGVEVHFEPRTPTTFQIISGDNQQVLTNSKLPIPFIVEVRDEHNQTFSEVPVTFVIIEGEGKLSNTTTVTDVQGRAQTYLTLGQNLGETTVRVTASQIDDSLNFTATAIPIDYSVTIQDRILYEKITETLGKPDDAILTVKDMLALTELNASNLNIYDLTGLEHALNLTVLYLDDNSINVPERLTGLTQLTTLSLDNNSLSNIRPISILTQLTTLSLKNNDVSDVSDLTQLRQLKTLDLSGNLLNYTSLNTHIPVLQRQGTSVAFDNRTPTEIHNQSASGHAIDGNAVVYVRVLDENDTAFAGVPVTLTLTPIGGSPYKTVVVTDDNGYAYVWFKMGSTPGENKVEAQVKGIPHTLNFSITGIDTTLVIQIPDKNLLAKIKETLNLPTNAEVTTGDMINLNYLYIPNANVQDLTGLEYAYNLRNLKLDAEYINGQGWVNNNRVTDFSPLQSLTLLSNLDLAYTPQLNLSEIAKLTQLKNLNLSNISESNLIPLAELTQLSYLWLGSNNITDISPLKSLSQLTYLNLTDNSISDLSPLTELLQLSLLDLSNNNITNISSLESLSQLTSLNLRGNSVSDLTPLASLKQLARLDLRWNRTISDISPLVGLNLTGTEHDKTGLRLEGNPLSNESIRTHIPAMQARGIVVTFDNITHPEFHLISGDEQSGIVGRSLSSPFVVEYIDANGMPKRGVRVTFSIRDGEGELTDKTVTTDADGRAQTFLHLGWKVGTVTVRATADGVISPPTFTAKAVLPENHVTEDVNVDGVVDVMDLVLVAATIGTTPPEDTYPNPDINGDGVVNSDDLVLVMAALENTPTAPAAVMTAENLRRWIEEAKQMTNKDTTLLRGISVLEQLLETLLPKKTALLANYPNPFNPETWIPYHLAKPAEVTLHIYGVDGALVRTLTLGHRQAGIYEHQTRAAYWDGRNAQGERVASGIYLYTLTAGEYPSTRKMLIRK